MATQRSRVKLWFAIVLGCGLALAGVIGGGSAGISLVIWLVEGKDPLKEFILATPDTGRATFLRGVGGVIGGSLGGGMGICISGLLWWKMGLFKRTD